MTEVSDQLLSNTDPGVAVPSSSWSVWRGSSDAEHLEFSSRCSSQHPEPVLVLQKQVQSVSVVYGHEIKELQIIK